MINPQQRFDTWIRIVLGAIIIVLLLLCALLVHQYHALRIQELRGTRLSLLHKAAAVPLTDVNLVQSWMTYDYISHVYALPADYLKTALKIADSRYPHVTIAESSEQQHITPAALTAEVKNAVSDYITAESPPSGS